MSCCANHRKTPCNNGRLSSAHFSSSARHWSYETRGNRSHSVFHLDRGSAQGAATSTDCSHAYLACSEIITMRSIVRLNQYLVAQRYRASAVPQVRSLSAASKAGIDQSRLDPMCVHARRDNSEVLLISLLSAHIDLGCFNDQPPRRGRPRVASIAGPRRQHEAKSRLSGHVTCNPELRNRYKGSYLIFVVMRNDEKNPSWIRWFIDRPTELIVKRLVTTIKVVVDVMAAKKIVLEHDYASPPDRRTGSAYRSNSSASNVWRSTRRLSSPC